MKNPRRRTSYENSLVKLIREAGFYAIRVPASGRHDSDAIGDVSMAYNGQFIAIEVKSTSQEFLYSSKIKDDAVKMVKKGREYKMPCIFAIRFIARTGGGWRFITGLEAVNSKKILKQKLFKKSDELENHLQQVFSRL